LLLVRCKFQQGVRYQETTQYSVSHNQAYVFSVQATEVWGTYKLY